MFAMRHRLAAVLVCLAGCATHAAPATGSNPAERVDRNPDIISTEELRDPAIAATDALNAIRLLRPAFFRTRGPQTLRGGDPATAPGQVQVSQDFGPLQPMAVLSSISARTVVEVRYFNAVDAQARFGINANGGPVIVVLSARQ